MSTFLVVAPFAWGKASTKKKALATALENVPTFCLPTSRRVTIQVVEFQCHPSKVEVFTGHGLSWTAPSGAQVGNTEEQVIVPET